MNRGVLYAAGAYISWGLLPIFWKALQHVPAFEILAHRIVWACLVGLALGMVRRDWAWLGPALRDWRVVLRFSLTAALISFNWVLYIWAVNAGHVIETSLGYFMNPLVNVALGVLILGERLRRGQVVAIGLALAGVLFLTVTYGAPPWIALALAGSFAGYGLLRKTAHLASLEGFILETSIMLLPALVGLAMLSAGGGGAFGPADPRTSLLLAASGAITALPLLLFAAGARRVTMTTLGLLQYIAPSLQFALGVLVYGEHLSPQRMAGFIIIWLALVIYSAEGVMVSIRARAQPSPLSSGDVAPPAPQPAGETRH